MILRLLFFLLLCLAPALINAVEITAGPKIEAAETTAVVRWTTDLECGSSVSFGLEESALNRRAIGQVGIQHEVKLDALQPGTQYFYSVGTAKKKLTTGKFTTLGQVASKPQPAKQPEAKPEREKSKTAAPATKSSPARTAPPTKQTWGDMDSLVDHYVRHGKDFSAASADDYAAKAWLFLQRAIDEGLPAKLDEDGTIRVWDGKSRAFAAYNRNFTTKTYFKPNSQNYFERQPGKAVRLRRPENP